MLSAPSDDIQMGNDIQPFACQCRKCLLDFSDCFLWTFPVFHNIEWQVLVIEELEHARARGARIYAEIVGYAMNSDAFHITAPPEDGEGAMKCMESALQDAKVPKSSVGYINAHGTSTFADRVETKVIKEVFGKQAYSIPISSTKSMTGHLLGAAGGIEAVFSILALQHGIIPPTINLDDPDPDCDLDYVPNQSRACSFDVAISNAFGFGGVNACLVFRRWQEA